MGNANFRHRLTVDPHPLKIKIKIKKGKKQYYNMHNHTYNTYHRQETIFE